MLHFGTTPLSHLYERYPKKFFEYILYADDTTLFSTIQISEALPKDINNQLAEVYNWLAVNKLSLNMKKTKYIVFHAINKSTGGLIP